MLISKIFKVLYFEFKLNIVFYRKYKNLLYLNINIALTIF